MPLKTMNELFHAELQRLYGQEKRVAGLLPNIGKAATSNELRNMLSDYSKQTSDQVKRLEKVFAAIDKTAAAKPCPRVEGLCKECEEVAALEGDRPLRDVAIIATSQHVMHDEIAGYGCARAWANILGHQNAANLLQDCLDEKKLIDTRFTNLAEKINKQAMALTT